MEIKEESKIKLKENSSKLSEENLMEINTKIIFFKKEFSSKKILKLDKYHYFQGKGIKDESNFTYQLEWKSKLLGGIGGGSVYKFGYEEDFEELKKFISMIISGKNKKETFYTNENNLTEFSEKIIKKSQKLKGVGRAYIGKVLSIYFSEIFLSIYGHQEFFLGKLFIDYKPEFNNVELYFQNNLLLLNYKEKYFSDLNLYEFVDLLYNTFYRKEEELSSKGGLFEEKIDALEVEHYQSLIHRNFKLLFKGLSYYDEEYQNSHLGHFNTEEVGILDILAKDDNNNLVVIELKRDSTDKTLGQILRYMGWVKENLCRNKQKVRGIIIAESKDNRLDYALKITDDIVFNKMELNVVIKKS